MDPQKAKLSIRLGGDSGEPLRDVSAFHELAQASKETTVWTMNAGMYHGDGSPVGLGICEGRDMSPVSRDEGHGNFFLKPNGIFAMAASVPCLFQMPESTARQEDLGRLSACGNESRIFR
jgi:uncharacterized protein YigE (DUF2233 family)